ncbi:MAG TPA: hypothetical protein VLK23_03160 [Thermodesulfobacteriota bacterium]|nr:hypothetical protein [Thermodesulfobacteriota bacterium]
MKKTLIVSMVFSMFLITILLTSEVASAHWRSHFNFGVYFAPPVVWPPVVGYPTYPPFGYYGPGYYGYRAWVPGYWEDRWTPYGWRRIWIPGFWRYGP